MLAEATVRVLLDLLRFNQDLNDSVKKAADQAGQQFDRDMRKNFRSTGRSAANEFRDAAKTAMGRAGTRAAADFETSFKRGVSKLASDVAARLSRQLQVSVGRAGIEAGNQFCDNLGRVLANCGRTVGRDMGNQIRDGITRNLAVSESAAAQAIGSGAVPAAREAGQRAGREFSLNFGLGTTRVGGPALAVFAAIGGEISSQLGPALPIVAGLAPLLAAVTAAAVIAVGAFEGFGDAVKAVLDTSTEWDDVNAAISRLSPAARSVVGEFRQMRTQFTELRSSIQEAFFTQLSGQVTRVANVLNGQLRPEINLVSTSLGRMTRHAIEAFTSVQGAADLRGILRGTSGFFDAFDVGFRSLLQGFLAFSSAAGPGLTTIGRALSDMLSSFGEFLSRSAASGDALVWLESGVTGMRELVAEVVNVARAFGVLLEAAQPIALALSGVFGVAIDLINAFGGLPGPLQTAALAALLLVRTGLPDFMRRATTEASPLNRTLQTMSAAYFDTANAARSAAVAQSVASARAATLIGVERAAAAAVSATARSANAVADAVNAVGRSFGRAADFATSMVPRVLIAADDAANAVGRSVAQAGASVTGFLPSIAHAHAGMQQFAQAASATQQNLAQVADRSAFIATSWRGGLIPAALAFNQAVTRTGIGLQNFAATVEDRVVRSVQATGDAMRVVAREGFGAVAAQAQIAANQLSTSVQTGFVRAGLAVENSSRQMGAAIQTGVIRASMAGATALDTLGGAIRSGFNRTLEDARVLAAGFGASLPAAVTRPVLAARDAYRSTSAALQAVTVSQNAFLASAARSTPIISRAQTALTSLSTVAVSTGAALRAGFGSPITTASIAMNTLGTAAIGAGRSIAVGLRSAVGGLVGLLGGPLGLALTGATIALALFASEQDKARRAAAEHDAAVSKLADTLDRQTGAVTDATTAEIAGQLARNDAGKAARRLGIDMGQLTTASLGNADAQQRVTSQLIASGTAALRTSGDFKISRENAQGYGVALEDIVAAALGSQAASDKMRGSIQAQGKSFQEAQSSIDGYIHWAKNVLGDQLAVGNAFRTSSGDIDKEATAIRLAADAAEQASGKTTEMATAVGVLGSESADADAKVNALTRALALLAGDTVSAATAQAAFTDAINDVIDDLPTAAEGMNNLGRAFISTNGQIDTTTKQGASLVDTFNNINGQLVETSLATVQAGQKNGDLAGAYKRVEADAQRARDAFIAQAKALGATQVEAEAAANAFGLIPRNVLTLVGTGGTAQITIKDVDTVKRSLAALPPNTPVRVQALTDEARLALVKLGYQITTMPDGSFEITANTSPAQGSIDKLIRNNTGKVIGIRVQVGGVDGVRIGGVNVASHDGNLLRYAHGGIRRLTPMRANYARKVPADTWRVVGDRSRDAEAFIPINRSRRSIGLLDQTAEEMGFRLMAAGGILGRSRGGSGGVTIAPGAIMVNAPFADAELVARKTLNALAQTVEM